MWLANTGGSMGEETDRRVVKTYLPAEQKQRWTQHADRLEMSHSEFVRTMVQAGRRGFGAEVPMGDSPGADESTRETVTPERSTAGQSGGKNDVEETGSPHVNPRGDGLEDRVLDVLREGTHSWEELVDAVVGDLEADLDETLQDLQSSGRIRYSGRTGGYELVDP
jgi:hypothetical protein